MSDGLRKFLGLFDESTLKALKLMSLLAMLLATTDFGIVLLLYPVLGSLLEPAGSASSVGPDFLAGWSSAALLMGAVGMLLLRAVGEFATRAWWTRRAGEAEIRLSSRVLAAYAHAPYAFHLKRNSADLLATAVAQVNMATSSGLNGLATIGADIASVVALVLALMVASTWAALLTCLGIGLLVVGFVTVNRSIVSRQTTRYTQHVGKTYARASTVLRGIRELTVADARTPALNEIDRARAEMVHAQQRLLLLGDVPRIVLEIVLYLSMFAATALLIASDRMALATVGLFLVAALRILPAVGRSLRTFTSMRAGIELGSMIVAELAELEPTAVGRVFVSEDRMPTASLYLQDLTFSYEAGGRRVLDRVNASIPFGSSIGVVGSSGSGKSTLLALVLGLLSPDSGRVVYGDYVVGEADPLWFRQVAYVPQDVYVLDDSVASNVSLGDPEPNLARIAEALRRAHLSDVVESMEAGLGTRLGEGGSRMSVGQRQRLGIARALYRNASVLLLDEPTAALDADNEARVVETLGELRGQVTTILISHRIAPVLLVDRVFRLKAGRLSEISVDESVQGAMS